ncbi:hypothetical protein CHELA40_13516 [Chelatococcus asaccharovorans]|nr:hypothetical protein CHELA40_13516 [Chelatococcus asaccharovorans]
MRASFSRSPGSPSPCRRRRSTSRTWASAVRQRRATRAPLRAPPDAAAASASLATLADAARRDADVPRAFVFGLGGVLSPEPGPASALDLTPALGLTPTLGLEEAFAFEEAFALAEVVALADGMAWPGISTGSAGVASRAFLTAVRPHPVALMILAMDAPSARRRRMSATSSAVGEAMKLSCQRWSNARTLANRLPSGIAAHQGDRGVRGACGRRRWRVKDLARPGGGV